MFSKETACETLSLKCNALEKIANLLSRRKRETQGQLNQSLNKLQKINKQELMKLEGGKLDELLIFLRTTIYVEEGRRNLIITLGDKEITRKFISGFLDILAGCPIFYEVYLPLVSAKTASSKYSAAKSKLKEIVETLKDDENYKEFYDILSDIYMIAERPMNIYDESQNLRLCELIANLKQACDI
ncbi:MAG: hypothetical protein PHP54_01355 [Clostridia bacterium]|nr:hypothetical protein [Clostridia bacterium]